MDVSNQTVSTFLVSLVLPSSSKPPARCRPDQCLKSCGHLRCEMHVSSPSFSFMYPYIFLLFFSPRACLIRPWHLARRKRLRPAAYCWPRRGRCVFACVNGVFSPCTFDESTIASCLTKKVVSVHVRVKHRQCQNLLHISFSSSRMSTKLSCTHQVGRRKPPRAV